MLFCQVQRNTQVKENRWKFVPLSQGFKRKSDLSTNSFSDNQSKQDASPGEKLVQHEPKRCTLDTSIHLNAHI